MMAGLWKYFQRQSLPNSKETSLGEVITNEANAAVESWRKNKMVQKVGNENTPISHQNKEQR